MGTTGVGGDGSGPVVWPDVGWAGIGIESDGGGNGSPATGATLFSSTMDRIAHCTRPSGVLVGTSTSAWATSRGAAGTWTVSTAIGAFRSPRATRRVKVCGTVPSCRTSTVACARPAWTKQLPTAHEARTISGDAVGDVAVGDGVAVGDPVGAGDVVGDVVGDGVGEVGGEVVGLAVGDGDPVGDVVGVGDVVTPVGEGGGDGEIVGVAVGTTPGGAASRA